jgi:general secretion pathway protein H
MRERGFTLIEMTVVLVILALVIGVAVSRGPSRSPTLELRMAAGSLATALRQARARAIATNSPVRVALDPARHLLAEDGRDPVPFARGLPVAIEGAIPAPRGVRVIRFGGDGSASGGAILLGTGKRQTAVRIQWLTGEIHVADAA